jgi:hypothetical protein
MATQAPTGITAFGRASKASVEAVGLGASAVAGAAKLATGAADTAIVQSDRLVQEALTQVGEVGTTALSQSGRVSVSALKATGNVGTSVLNTTGKVATTAKNIAFSSLDATSEITGAVAQTTSKVAVSGLSAVGNISGYGFQTVDDVLKATSQITAATAQATADIAVETTKSAAEVTKSSVGAAKDISLSTIKKASEAGVSTVELVGATTTALIKGLTIPATAIRDGIEEKLKKQEVRKRLGDPRVMKDLYISEYTAVIKDNIRNLKQLYDTNTGVYKQKIKDYTKFHCAKGYLYGSRCGADQKKRLDTFAKAFISVTSRFASAVASITNSAELITVQLRSIQVSNPPLPKNATLYQKEAAAYEYLNQFDPKATEIITAKTADSLKKIEDFAKLFQNLLNKIESELVTDINANLFGTNKPTVAARRRKTRRGSSNRRKQTRRN